MTDAAAGKPISYDEAKALAADKDPKVREALARRADLRPEILFFLAADTSAEVRRAVAENETAPRQTDILLARDAEADVRAGLAEKIAAVAPDLSADEKNRIHRSTHEALEVLARDQMTMVRQVLAEALKDVAHAPADIVKTLARDTEIAVSGPVLEFSPVLTDDDLIEIIRSGPAAGGLNAIAKRKTVGESVSDAIAATDDISAIADLLGNHGAQLREETLDSLIERSVDIDLWHAPLVGRPTLPPKAAMRLAEFLADNLLDVLQKRADLDADTLAAVKSSVHQRLSGGPAKAVHAGPRDTPDFLNPKLPLDNAKQLYAAGRLDTAAISNALQAGDHPMVFASLVVRSGIDPKVARMIFSEKSAKGIVAVVWKAKLPMKLAVLVQQRMGRVAPSELIKPMMGDDYPMGDEELKWQLDFYANMAAKGA